MFSREKDNTFVSFPTKNFVLGDFSDDLTSLDLFGSVVRVTQMFTFHELIERLGSLWQS